MEVFHQRLEQEHGADVIATAPTVPFHIYFPDKTELHIQNPSVPLPYKATSCCFMACHLCSCSPHALEPQTQCRTLPVSQVRNLGTLRKRLEKHTSLNPYELHHVCAPLGLLHLPPAPSGWCDHSQIHLWMCRGVALDALQ